MNNQNSPYPDVSDQPLIGNQRNQQANNPYPANQNQGYQPQNQGYAPPNQGYMPRNYSLIQHHLLHLSPIPTTTIKGLLLTMEAMFQATSLEPDNI